MAGVAAGNAGRLSIEIVAEIARLQSDLDKAKRMVKSASGDISASTKIANDNLGKLGAGFGKAGVSSKQAAYGMRNMAFQMQDLGVQLAQASQSSNMLQMALMAFVMQGPQIKNALDDTGMSAGQMVARFAKAHPILLATTAAAGVLSVAFKQFYSDIAADGELKGFAASLGLTKKEMKELGPVSVTVGDAIKGLWRTIDEGLGISSVFKSIAGAVVGFFKAMWEAGKATTAGIYAAFVGTYEGVKATWSMLPAAMADATVNAANAAIHVLEDMVNKSLGMLNAMVVGINSMLNTSIGTIDAVNFDPIKNQHAGAGAEVAGAFVNAYQTAYGEAQSGFDKFADNLSKNILDVTKERLSAKAAELIADRADKAEKRTRKASQALARHIEAIEATIQANYKLADAYLESSEAAFVAEVRVKAVAEAIKKQADVESYVALKLREAVSERAVAAARQAAALNDQAKAQEFVNEHVRTGALSIDNASEALTRMAEQREILTAIQVAGANGDVAGAEAAEKALNGLTEAQLRYIKAKRQAADIQQSAQINSDIAYLQEEIELTEQLGEQRLKALRGLSGASLEDEMARIAVAHQKATIQMRAEAEAADLLAKGLNESAEAVLRRAEADKALVDLEEKFRREAEAIARFNHELREALHMMGDFGEMFGLGRGFGDFLFKLDDTDFGHEFLQDLKGTLDDVFGGAGSFNQALGAFGLAVEANKMIGDIFGFKGGPFGIFTSLIDGILNPNRTAGADITGPNSVVIGGKDRDNYGAAGDLGNAVLEGLSNVADQLGATLGEFRVSIGMRGDEFRVNTNGGSLKYKNGAQGFGEDSDAAIMAAIADAIKDGALQGLSAASEALLNAGGDLEEQLSKVLQFESVFDELERMKDPTGFATKQLEAEFEKLKAIFDEAGASADEYAKLEELRTLKLAEINEQAGQAAEDNSKRRELELALMVAQGDYMGALALARQEELDELDESLHALQQQVWAAELANEKRTLEIQLMEAMGDAAGSVAAQRERELQATHESLRGLKEQIWAAQDAAAAQAELAQAQQEAADAAQRIAEQRRALEIQLMDSASALAAQRADELAAIDPTLRALQQQVWAAQDAARANEELARAQEDAAASATAAAQRMQSLQVRLFDAQGNDTASLALRRKMEQAEATAAERDMLDKIYAAEDAAKKAADAAAKREAAQQRAEERARAAEAAAAERARIAEQRANMEVALLRALGKETEALAKQRKIELAGMDASLRGLQQQIWAAEEASQTADKFREFGKSLREFRNELTAGEQETANAYRAAQVKFMTTSALARAGDETALGNLRGVGQSFLDASRSRAGSMVEFQRDLSAVLRSVDDAIDYTDDQVDMAQAQLNAIERGNSTMREMNAEIAGMRAEMQATQIAQTTSLSAIRRRLDNAEAPGGGLRVVTETAA